MLRLRLKIYSLGHVPQAMGGAFAAVANDSNAVYWNPAGMALAKQGRCPLYARPLRRCGRAYL